jgi:hypothetical protein
MAMVRGSLYRIVIVAAGLALAGRASAVDAAKDAPAPSKGFYAKYLTPRMNSRLDGEISAASAYTDPTANPWTRDDLTIARIERGARRAATGALKQYAIQSLQINAWSVPLFGAKDTGVDAFREESGGTRLRFGIAHFTPRADVTIPGANGRVVVSVDARGRLGTAFETPTAKLSFGVSYDPPTQSGAFSLSRRF